MVKLDDKSQIINRLNKLGPLFVANVTSAINQEGKKVGGLDSYEIVWKQLQDIAAKEILVLLKKEFKGCDITVPKSKSTYPDIKMSYGGYLFAIDIKSNESQKDPWFDMARLDTVVIKRLQAYDEEWELIIKYDSATKKFLKAYFNFFREIVGKRDDCNGVKYRPYDGKLRPKSWADFDNNVIYWATNEDFVTAIFRSQKNRWRTLMRTTIVPALTTSERKDFKKLFD